MTAEPQFVPQQEAAGRGGAALSLHIALAALTGFVCTAIWALAGSDYFWPAWVWAGAAVTVVLHAIGWHVARAPRSPRRVLEGHALVATTIALILGALWALTAGEVFWPAWPLLGLAAAVALHGVLVALGWAGPRPREEELVERVDELTRTRRGALDVQATQLRRIERDLHDGAQARLVALSMQLGRAEEKLADRPDVVELVRGAREEAGAAIAELRDLARGIAPPVLADRGLAAAVEGLAQRSPLKVDVDVDVDRRPPPVVETAAYFVVAEALTNAAKHGGGAPARVWVRLNGDSLAVEVSDSGTGGADPDGSGLTGLRHRVEALDCRLAVSSPPGAGTVLRAELPCAW